MTTAVETRRDPNPLTPPNHHLDDALLLDYAAGTTSEAVSLIVAAHLTLCPECRARAAMLDALGGALLEESAPIENDSAAFDTLMARIDAGSDRVSPSAPQPPAANDNPILPTALRSYIGGDVGSIRWQPIGLGVEIADLVSDQSGVRAFMLKVPGGRKVPKHTHVGNEYVMVLQGAYTDESGRFGRGDIEIADGDVEHQPVAEAGTDCICLAVTDAPLRITGPFGWLMNRFSKL